MKLTTLASLVASGRLQTLLAFKGLFTDFYRVCFLASIVDTPILDDLVRNRGRLEIPPGDPSVGAAFETWLGLGVALGLLKKKGGGYALRGSLARRFIAPGNDAIRALAREVASLHHLYMMETPGTLRGGALWNADGRYEQFGDIIARSSRTLEPFLFELIDRHFPKSGSPRLLEVGCGNAGYILHAARRHAGLDAVGLELDPRVAETARAAVRAAGLQERVRIEVADVRNYDEPGTFDVVTLYNNIYYFPVEERVSLLKRLRDRLNPGGILLLTTGCMNGSIEFELVNLIHGTTRGWGRLPFRDEMLRQMTDAGLERNAAKNLVPGNAYYAFIGRAPR